MGARSPESTARRCCPWRASSPTSWAVRDDWNGLPSCITRRRRRRRLWPDLEWLARGAATMLAGARRIAAAICPWPPTRIRPTQVASPGTNRDRGAPTAPRGMQDGKSRSSRPHGPSLSRARAPGTAPPRRRTGERAHAGDDQGVLGRPELLEEAELPSTSSRRLADPRPRRSIG